MRALTVKQPWAWAIMHAGKDVENRSRFTKYRGELLIHAGVALDPHGCRKDGPFLHWDARIVAAFPPMPDHLDYGAIVGKVTVVGCVTNSESRWAVPGQWHWQLADPVVFDEPIPCRGMLGLWTPPAEVMAA